MFSAAALSVASLSSACCVHIQLVIFPSFVQRFLLPNMDEQPRVFVTAGIHVLEVRVVVDGVTMSSVPLQIVLLCLGEFLP